jgi:hypothetical protein
VIIVGGTYQEHVTVPAYEMIAGSGLRAAAALAPHGLDRLVTAVDDRHHDVAKAAFAALRVNAESAVRDEPVAFHYFSPILAPTIDGPSATYAPGITADDDTILVFGMVEKGQRIVRARRTIFDPQRPRDLTVLDLEGIRTDELAVLANASEARSLSGEADLEQAAQFILNHCAAEVVVVKAGSRGALVCRRAQSEIIRIGPFPTRSVWPLGSGDVFAAGFSHAWAAGADPIDAARVASGCAAWWCGTRTSVLPAPILDGDPVTAVLESASPELTPISQSSTVYLAAPFFTLAERWLVEACRTALTGLGVQVFSPFHDVGPGGDEVAVRDLAGLDGADAVLALLDGWDPGTVYEVGWAHHRGLPVVGFLQGPGHEGTKMLVGSGAELHQDLSSAIYRAAWAAQNCQLTPSRIVAS